MTEQYRKFQESKQEAVKLTIALSGYFLETDPQRKDAYGRYIQRRIRPAMEQLLGSEEFEKLEALDRLGWFGGREVDDLIQVVRGKQMVSGLVWLLKWKQENGGFSDRDFSL